MRLVKAKSPSLGSKKNQDVVTCFRESYPLTLTLPLQVGSPPAEPSGGHGGSVLCPGWRSWRLGSLAHPTGAEYVGGGRHSSRA